MSEVSRTVSTDHKPTPLLSDDRSPGQADFVDDEVMQVPEVTELGAAPAAPVDAGEAAAGPVTIDTPATREETIAVFCFGYGGAWVTVMNLGQEVPVYQNTLHDLTIGNKLAIAYNLGYICAAIFIVLRAVGIFRESEQAYARLLPWMMVLQLLASIGCIFVSMNPTMGTLMLINFLGGTAGNFAQFITVPWLVMSRKNALVATFWMGDGACGITSAIWAIIQQPGKDPPYISAPSFILINTVFVLASPMALYYILKYNIGRIEPRVRSKSEGPCRPDQASKDAEMIEMEGGPVPVAVDDGPASPRFGALGTRSCATMCAALGRWVRVCGWRGMLLGLVVFWSQFADWGIGSSVYTYACDHADAGGDGGTCLEVTNIGSSLSVFAGEAVTVAIPAALIARRSQRVLVLGVPVVLYTLFFVFMWRAAVAGKGNGAAVGWGSSWVPFVMIMLRAFGPYTRVMTSRYTQFVFPRKHWGTMPTFYGVCGLLGNCIGVAAASGMIGAGYFDAHHRMTGMDGTGASS